MAVEGVDRVKCDELVIITNANRPKKDVSSFRKINGDKAKMRSKF